MENNLENKLIVIKNNQAVISEEVETLLDEYEKTKSEFEEAEKNFRNSLLSSMIKHDIMSAKVGKYTLSQIVPKPTKSFCEEKFMEENDIDTISIFTKIEETSEFDITKFIKENPELYNKYCIKKENIVVDVDKLEKLRPDLYTKYMIHTQSDKKITLRINKSRK